MSLFLWPFFTQVTLKSSLFSSTNRCYFPPCNLFFSSGSVIFFLLKHFHFNLNIYNCSWNSWLQLACAICATFVHDLLQCLTILTRWNTLRQTILAHFDNFYSYYNCNIVTTIKANVYIHAPGLFACNISNGISNTFCTV